MEDGTRRGWGGGCRAPFRVVAHGVGADEQRATTALSYADQLIQEGRKAFRDDTFGDEAFWGGQLRLHQAIAGAANGGVGPGVSPETALAVGLKVDLDRLPPALVLALKLGQVNLKDPATTIALLKLNAVVGVRGFFDPNSGSDRGDGDPVRALPLDGRQRPRGGHRTPAGWLAEPRPERRRDRRARAQSLALHDAARRRATPPCARCSGAGVRASSTPS